MNDLKHYVFKKLKDCIVLIGSGLVFSGAGALIFFRDKSYGFGAVLFIIGIALIVAGIAGKIKQLIAVIKWKKDGIYDDAKEDFFYAEPFADDRIRLGRKFIFNYANPVLYKYGDIQKVRYFAFNGRSGVNVMTAEGKFIRLCEFFDGEHRDEADKIISRLKQCNPKIEVIEQQ